MCLERGEGEEEIVNHGRSRVKSFSQETGAIGQQAPRIGEHEPKLHSQNQVQEAQDSPTQLPFFSLLTKVIGARKESGSGTLHRVAASDSPRACFSFLASTKFFFSFLIATAALSWRCGTRGDSMQSAASTFLARRRPSQKRKKGGFADGAFKFWPSADCIYGFVYIL